MEATLTVITHILIIRKQGSVVMDARNFRILAAMIALLSKGKRARLSELARAMPGGGTLESRAQKLRRWLSNANITAQDFLPVYLQLLSPVLATMPEILLIIDRTSWNRLGININLFLCSVAFNGRSVPIFWFFFPKRGGSNLSEHKKLLSPVLAALAAHPILSTIPVAVTADREFCSPLLADWLVNDCGVHVAIRVKKNVYVARDDFIAIHISHILKKCNRGHEYFFPHVRLTAEHEIRVNLLICWREDCDEAIAVITDHQEKQTTAAIYPQRPWIDTLNRDLTSGGFDIERGKITDSDRISRLLIAVAFAYILLLIPGHVEDIHGPPTALKKGHNNDVVPDKKRSSGRPQSLFSQARNRITDLLDRVPLPGVYQFFEQFFDFLMILLNQHVADTVTTLFKTYARRQCLLLKGFQSSVMC